MFYLFCKYCCDLWWFKLKSGVNFSFKILGKPKDVIAEAKQLVPNIKNGICLKW